MNYSGKNRRAISFPLGGSAADASDFPATDS